MQIGLMFMPFGPKELRKAGEASYGRRWQTELSRALNLSTSRRIRQWLSGERTIPDTLREDLIEHLKSRKMSIDKALNSLLE